MNGLRLSRALIFALLAACATTSSERPVQPERPPSSAELSYVGGPGVSPFDYGEAVDQGLRYIANQGYSDAQLHGVDQPYPNIWRVRFGRGDNGALHLYFDGANRTLIKAEELQGVKGALVPSAAEPPPKK
jgi:hypothetical protein